MQVSTYVLSHRKNTTPSLGGLKDPTIVCRSDRILPISSTVSTSRSFCCWSSSRAGTNTIPNSIAPKFIQCKVNKNDLKYDTKLIKCGEETYNDVYLGR